MTKIIREFFLGGISLSLVNISSKVVNLIILPVITFYLLPEDFGIIAIYSLIIGILGMIYNPGIISVTIRLYYDNEDSSIENKRLVGSSFGFLIIIPILLLLFSVFYGDLIFLQLFNDFDFWPYGFLAILAAMTVQPVRLWSNLWIAKKKVNRVAIISLLKIFISVILTLLLIIILELDAMGRILALLTSNFVIFIFASYDIINYSKLNFSFNKLIKILILGFPLVFSVFSYVLMESTDKYMLEIFTDLGQLGIYDIAYTLSSIPLFIILGFSQVWQPIFYENMKKNLTGNIKKISNYYIISFSLVVFFVLIFSNEVFNLFIDQKFISALNIVPWIISGVFFLGLSNLIATIYTYEKRFKMIGFLAIISAVINVFLNYYLINYFGTIGAAISSFITYLCYFLLLFYNLRNNIFDLFSKQVLIGSICIFLFFSILLIFFNNLLIDFNLYYTLGKIILSLLIIYVLIKLKLINLADLLDKKNKS